MTNGGIQGNNQCNIEIKSILFPSTYLSGYNLLYKTEIQEIRSS